jgi:hypothetical protein
MPEIAKQRVFQTLDRHRNVVFSSLSSDKAFEEAERLNREDRHSHHTVTSYVLDERK